VNIIRLPLLARNCTGRKDNSAVLKLINVSMVHVLIIGTENNKGLETRCVYYIYKYVCVCVCV